MRKRPLVTAAVAALSVPAVAQSLDHSNDMQSQSQHQMTSPQSTTQNRSFQQQQNMGASGQLDQQTLQALGVNMTHSGRTRNRKGHRPRARAQARTSRHRRTRRRTRPAAPAKTARQATNRNSGRSN